MSKESKKSRAVVMPLRIPKDLQKRIRPLAKKTRLSDGDILRLAIERGLDNKENNTSFSEVFKGNPVAAFEEI